MGYIDPLLSFGKDRLGGFGMAALRA